MNQAHIHLIINHFPVVGTVFGLLILLYAIFKNNDEFLKFSLKFFVLVGVTSVFAFLTGEPAEEFVEHLPGFSEEVIEKHEEISQIALIFSLLTSGASILTYAYFNKLKKYKKSLINIILVSALATCFFMGLAANMGGKIRHDELNSSMVSQLKRV
ncbi:MAG: hypothetical protein IPM57_10165 [Oligoflexia bacterium]|nr:hypothetical protein [Oligoflexia bacterium]